MKKLALPRTFLFFLGMLLMQTSGHSATRCALHNSKYCEDPVHYRSEKEIGCASQGGACRKVFCHQVCLQIRSKDIPNPKSAELRKLIEECGEDCSLSQTLIRMDDREREKIYLMLGESIKPSFLKGDVFDYAGYRSALNFIIKLFNKRTLELKAERAGSMTYALKSSFQTQVKNLSKVSRAMASSIYAQTTSRVKARGLEIQGRASKTARQTLDRTTRIANQAMEQGTHFITQPLEALEKKQQELQAKLDETTKALEEAAGTQNQAIQEALEKQQQRLLKKLEVVEQNIEDGLEAQSASAPPLLRKPAGARMGPNGTFNA